MASGILATLLLSQMVLNAYHDLVAFSLPETPGGLHWQLLIGTLADEAELGTYATGMFSSRMFELRLYMAGLQASPFTRGS